MPGFGQAFSLAGRDGAACPPTTMAVVRCMATRLHSSTEVNHPIWLVISVLLLKLFLAAITVRVSWLMEKARPEHHTQLIVTATGAFLLLLLAVTLIPNG